MPRGNLTPEDAGKILGVHPNTVRSWLDRGPLVSLAEDDVRKLKEQLERE